MDGPNDGDSRIEQYSGDSDSWFLVYCGCQACRCQNRHSKVRERLAEGRVLYWCTYCFKNHRAQDSKKPESSDLEYPEDT